MKKRILSILLCFCMVLSLLPVPVLAATHTLTVTGGEEGTDYQWGGNIYTTYGELYIAENVLVILTSKELTITGDTKNQAGFKDAISINSGVTANLTLNGVNLVSSSSSAGVTIAPGGTLNLTLQGTNTFTQNPGSDFRNCPAIRVPEGASLTVTDKSTGSLTSSTSNGSAVIGGYNWENCGTVTINGGIFDLSATGAENVDYIGGPAIGPGAYGRNGTITINGGYIKAYSQWGAAIGSGYNVVMGQIGQQNETISINGGTVVASSDNTVADGIGGYAKAITGGVTINGGSVSTTVSNTRPKNTGGNNLYKAALTLHDAAEGTLVNSFTAKTASGVSYSYNPKDIVTDSSGRIYVWLPEGSTVTKITAGGTNYTGASVVAMSDSETEIFYPENSTIKKYTLTTEINDGRIVTLSDIKCDLTIYDETGASETFQNLPFEKDKNNPSRATVASYEFYTAKTNIQKINIVLCSGGISWEKDVEPDKNVWVVNIGARLYKTMLIFRNEAITTDIAVESVTIKQGGTQLDAAKGEFYVPKSISKQTEGYGTMEAYLPENSSSTEVSVKAASLNDGNAITKTGQTITADNLTSVLMLNKTSSEAVVFTDTLDISNGNITFEDASGDLKITYSDASGIQQIVTTFFEGKYRINGSTTINGIKVLSTGGTTLQLVLDNVTIEKKATESNWAYEQNSPPFNIEGESKVSILLVGKNKISSDIRDSRNYSRAAICVKVDAALVIGGDGSLEASTIISAAWNRASVIGGSGYSDSSSSSVDKCGTIRIEGGDITLNANKAGISGGYYNGAVSNYGSFTMTGGNLKINSSDNAIGVKDVNITGGTIEVGDKTIYGDSSLSVAGGTIVAGNFNAGGSGSITVTGGTMFNPNGEQTNMNKPAENQTVLVYPVTADVSNIYVSNSDVSEAVITDVNYGFKDVKTDDNGVLHLYLPENANTKATFKGIAYQGSVGAGKDNILTIQCSHEHYTEDGYCTVCGSPQPANWNEVSSIYEISNEGQLEWFSKLVNGTLSDKAQNASANGKLLKDVTEGIGFIAIGTNTSPYTGVFDGGGHTITLSIDKGSSSYQGLFGAVGGGVTVKNIGVAGTVNGGAFTAGLIGGSSGSDTVTIQNCWNEATVTGTAENAAGIFGCNTSGATISIENCYNIGAVSGNRESAGISGWLGNGAIVTNCYNASTVSGADNGKTFARYENATFTNCYQLDTIGTQDSITAKTLDAFKSGEFTYLLNGSKSETPLTWGQIIGINNFPVFYDGNNTVYKIDDNTYSNSIVKLTANNPSNITGESADIAVSGDMGATVYYVKSDTQLTDGNKVEELAKAAQSVILQSDTATISLTNLTENTAYTYYMVAKVGNNYSKVVSVNFKTLLLPPTNSEVTVDYDNELLKSVASNSYTLEYALQTGATDWKEVTEQGISLTTLLNDHSGTENINLYLRKKSGESISDEFAYAIPARPDCNVTELAIDYINEIVKMPNTVKYQFSISSPASWDLATNGAGSEVSLNSYISLASTAVESLNKIYFRNPATESAFASKTASVTIPPRPDTPVAPLAASITDSSVTLTVVTGAEYSKDSTNWQDSPEFTGLAVYANHIFYQRFKATGNSFSSAYSTETIKTGKQSITGATVSLDKTNFIYNGKIQMPTVTVKVGKKELAEGTDYTVSYSNSNGNANDTTNVGTITVTVEAKDSSYLGTANSKPTYTIDKATFTPSISGTTSKEYDGNTTVDSGLFISLSGIQNNDSVSATADYAYDNKNVGNGKAINASNITLSDDNGNYTLASKTATAKVGTITAKMIDATISGDSTHIYDGNANYNHTATYTTIGSDKADVTIKYDGSATKPVDVKIKDSNVEAYALTAVINDNNYVLKDMLETTSFTISPAVINANNASKTILYTNTTTQTAIAANFGINMDGIFTADGEVNGSDNILKSVEYGENVTYTLNSGLGYSSQFATIPIIFTPNSKNYTLVHVNLTVSLADKVSITTPSAFTLQFELNADGATYTATIPAVSDAEYSFNGTDWNNINTKTDVAPGTSVTGYIRMKETEDKNASDMISNTQTAPILMVKTPTASPDGGSFTGSQTVTLACETEGADIYYTIDGSTPTNSNTKYTEAFTLSDTTTVKAMAVKAGMKNSEVMTVIFTKNSSGGNSGGVTIDINTNVTVLVSSDEGSVKATVTVEDNAAILKISDKQIEEIASGKTKTGKIKLDASDLKVDTVIVPTELVSAANNDSSFSGLEIILPTGIVTLDKTALNSVGSKSDVKISVDTVSNSKLTYTQKSMLGTQASSAVIVDVNVYVGDNKTSTFNNGKIQVSVHYTLKSHEKAENITVWFIKDDGTIEPKNGVYNSTTGYVDFTVEHLSQYLIVSFPFTDVAESEWCYASVAYAYNNGLFYGTSETSFSPNAAMTRQMIWMVLARMDGKTPADMDEARTLAVENGISDGSNPISTITREQMAVILYRYATYKKYDTTQGGMAIREFSDYDSISKYALTALDWTVNAGLIQGSNNYVMSSGSATRAQVATILMRFCQNVAK